MTKLQARWIHGTSVMAENPQNMTRVWCPGFGAFFNATGKEWFHFAIPTPVILYDEKVTLKRVFVFYKTENGAKFNAVHVYDSKHKVSGLDNLGFSGDFSNNAVPQNTWDILTPYQPKHGIGISVEIDFGPGAPGLNPGIWFITAGADFETP